MKTLVAHEWIAEVGGSENVFEQIRRIVPNGRAVCLWNDDPERFHGVEETWLASLPLRGRKAAAMPFMGSAWGRVDLTNVDRVVVSSHAFAHHLASRAARSGIPSFAYVHSPARYVWVPQLDTRGDSVVGRLGRSYFRRWDRLNTSSAVRYAANSAFVAERMADAWNVEASVIHPPVDVEHIRRVTELTGVDGATADLLPPQFVLGASRFVPYKNLEAAILAGELLDLPVVLAGAGPDEHRLRAIAQQARTPVRFVGRVSDGLLSELYRRASLFVYMPIEDFGIMPVEAMAAGTPVLVNELGGARESVLAAGGGVASGWRRSKFTDWTAAENALRTDMTSAVSEVDRFSVASFRHQLQSWLGCHVRDDTAEHDGQSEFKVC